MKMKVMAISLILVIVGALNWGLIGIFGFDLVATLFSFSPTLVRIIISIVGVAGLYLLFFMKDICALMDNRLIK